MTIAPSYLVALIAGLAFGMALYLGHVGRTAWRGYRHAFQDAAERNLAEMFLFVDPRALFAAHLLLLVLVFGLVSLAGGGFFLALLISLIAGASPPLIYAALRRHRLRMAMSQLPDTLLSLATSLRSGHSFMQSLETAATHQQAPLGQELALVLRELRIGVPHGDAMDNLYRRLPEVEIQLLTAAMKISREIGGNLAETLERISDTLRRRLQMEGKIRSLTAQGRLQGLVMTGLPVFLVVALNQLEPRAMQFLFTAWYGWATIALIVLMEAVGYHFIQKIVNIDV